MIRTGGQGQGYAQELTLGPVTTPGTTGGIEPSGMGVVGGCNHKQLMLRIIRYDRMVRNTLFYSINIRYMEMAQKNRKQKDMHKDKEKLLKKKWENCMQKILLHHLSPIL